MLNRVGSLHCGSCGQLLTDTTEVPEVQFKAPKLAPGAVADLDGSVERAPDAATTDDSTDSQIGGDATLATQFGMQLDSDASSSDESSASYKTIMGMPVIRLDEHKPPDEQDAEIHIQEDVTIRGRALSDAFDSATPSAQAPVFSPPTGPPPPSVAASPPARPPVAAPPSTPVSPAPAPPSTSVSPRVRALADTGEDDDPAPRRTVSKTLFGMRAAELHLGLAQSDTSPGTGGGPSLKEAFPALGDTAEFKAVRPAPDLGAPPPKAEKPAPNRDVQIHSVASVRGSGPGFAETAVIRAVGGPAPEFQGLSAIPTTAPQGDAVSPTSDVVLTPTKPLPSSETLARSVIAIGRVAPKSTGRSGSRPTAISDTVANTARDSIVARGLRLLAGLSLVAASLLPLATSTWTRVGVWDDLVPVILGAVGLVLAFSRRIPLMLALLVGLAGGFLGVFTYLNVGVPSPDAGLETVLRFGLTMGGGVLLLLAGFVALARPAARPLVQPPPS